MLSTLLTLVAAALVAAPPPADVVPMGQEPLHALRTANPILAVYDVTVPAGAVMRWHAHPTAHIAVPIAMAKLRNEVVGAPPVEHLTPPGTLVFLPAGPVHRQSNIDTHTAAFIAVEFLAPTGATNPVLPAIYATELDNSTATIARIELAPGARAAWPAFQQGVLLLSVRGGRIDLGGQLWVSAAGGTRWVVPRKGAALINRGAADVQVLVIAPK